MGLFMLHSTDRPQSELKIQVCIHVHTVCNLAIITVHMLLHPDLYILLLKFYIFLKVARKSPKVYKLYTNIIAAFTFKMRR